jgi:hypothetical protein
METTKKPRGRKTAAGVAGEVSPTILSACRAALALQAARDGLKGAKGTLSALRPELERLGVTAEVVREARAMFGVTFSALHGIPSSSKSRQKPASGLARTLVRAMSEAAGIDPAAYASAENATQRKALTARAVKALQRLSPPVQRATKQKDIFEAAQAWAEKMAKEFTSFRPSSLNDPAFKRFVNVIFDALTIE